MKKEATKKTKKVTPKATSKKVVVKKVSALKVGSTISINKATTNSKSAPLKKFSVAIHMNATTVKGKGKTIEDCLNKIDIPFFKTKGTIVISDGVRSKELTFRPHEVKRLLSRDVNKTIFAKRMSLMLK